MFNTTLLSYYFRIENYPNTTQSQKDSALEIFKKAARSNAPEVIQKLGKHLQDILSDIENGIKQPRLDKIQLDKLTAEIAIIAESIEKGLPPPPDKETAWRDLGPSAGSDTYNKLKAHLAKLQKDPSLPYNITLRVWNPLCEQEILAADECCQLNRHLQSMEDTIVAERTAKNNALNQAQQSKASLEKLCSEKQNLQDQLLQKQQQTDLSEQRIQHLITEKNLLQQQKDSLFREKFKEKSSLEGRITQQKLQHEAEIALLKEQLRQQHLTLEQHRLTVEQQEKKLRAQSLENDSLRVANQTLNAELQRKITDMETKDREIADLLYRNSDLTQNVEDLARNLEDFQICTGNEYTEHSGSDLSDDDSDDNNFK